MVHPATEEVIRAALCDGWRRRPMAPVCVRAMTAEEYATVKTLAHSRTAPACLVERAQIIWRASRGETTADIAAHGQLDPETVRKRIHRFNAEGARRAQGEASLWA